LAKTYRDFFTPITALAITSVLEAVRLEGVVVKTSATSNYPSLSKLAQVKIGLSVRVAVRLWGGADSRRVRAGTLAVNSPED
jgi:hypothetical protein